MAAGDERFATRGLAVRGDFFDIFDYEFLIGDAGCLESDSDIIVSESYATKLAGKPESEYSLTASDVNAISADAVTAMQWAVEMGILKGNLDGTLNPNGNASRAHVAAFTERYVNALAN